MSADTTTSTGSTTRSPTEGPATHQMAKIAPAVATRRIAGVHHEPSAPIVIAAPMPATASEAVRSERVVVDRSAGPGVAGVRGTEGMAGSFANGVAPQRRQDAEHGLSTVDA